MFIDGSYEGDLLPQSGVSYIIGRESEQKYNESIGGIRPMFDAVSNLENFAGYVDPFYLNGTLLPFINGQFNHTQGDSDGKTQSYTYRLCISNQTENKIDFPMPEGYDSDDFILVSRTINSWINDTLISKGNPPTISDIFYLISIPNNKMDVVTLGYWGISTDMVGGSWEYPDGNETVRETIRQNHHYFISGLIYYLSHDENVPQQTRSSVSSWGLCADEFIDTDNWPRELYVREARRMIGDQVFTLNDWYLDSRNDSIGMGSWFVDCHHVQRIVANDNYLFYTRNEGLLYLPRKGIYVEYPHVYYPFPIPYFVMLPKKSQVQNLLVPIALSASHVGFNTLRLEPTWMIIGQAAGVAASVAIKQNCAVQDISIDYLTSILLKQQVILEI